MGKVISFPKRGAVAGLSEAITRRASDATVARAFVASCSDEDALSAASASQHGCACWACAGGAPDPVSTLSKRPRAAFIASGLDPESAVPTPSRLGACRTDTSSRGARSIDRRRSTSYHPDGRPVGPCRKIAAVAACQVTTHRSGTTGRSRPGTSVASSTFCRTACRLPWSLPPWGSSRRLASCELAGARLFHQDGDQPRERREYEAHEWDKP